MQAMECSIYKGKRKPDHYLFMPADTAVDEIPADIHAMLGDLQLVMNLDIHENSVLAQSDPQSVIETIHQKGFYIQIPPQEFMTK